MTNKPLAPAAWLWSELDGLLSDATLADLRSRYEAHRKRYNRQAQLRTAQRELALYERIVTTYGPDSQQHQRYAKKIASRKARIALLENE